MRKQLNRARFVPTFFVAVVLAPLFMTMGCSGGGESGNSPVSNPPPVASADQVAPSLVIAPTGGEDSFSTKNPTATITGQASDNVALASIKWENSLGGSGLAQGTSQWSIPDLPLKVGDNIITVTATDTAGNIASSSITVTHNPNLSFLSRLQATPNTLFANEAASIVFRVAMENSPNLNKSTVKVVRIDSQNAIVGTVATLADDGNVANGDDIASDGVFSGKASLNEPSVGTVRLRVSATTVSQSVSTVAFSSIIKIIVTQHLSDAEFGSGVSLPSETKLKIDSLLQNNSPDKAKSETVAWLKSKPDVGEAGISESGEGIWYVLKSGILGGALLNPTGTKGGRESYVPLHPLVEKTLPYFPAGLSADVGDEKKLVAAAAAASQSPSVKSKNVLVISPFANQGGASQLPSQAYDNVFALFNNSSCPAFKATRVLGSNATVETFKDLSQFGVIVIDTHGDAFFNLNLHNVSPGLDDVFAKPFGKVVFLTGQLATATDKAKYEADLKAGRLAIIAGYYAITPAFITYYASGLSNSIIFNGSCRSFFNDTMANAFLSRGAKAYYGYTEYVAVSYDSQIVPTLFNSLLKTGRTASEAFSDAVTAHGTNDGQTKPAFFKFSGTPDLKIGDDGLANGSFEDGTSSGWNGQGDFRIIPTLGPLVPQDGSLMAIISTGLGANSDSNSVMEQKFCIPAGVTAIVFDYNVVSEEPMEWVGSQFDDAFIVTLETAAGTPTTLASESINKSQWSSVSGIDFDGGDKTVFMTGWKHISIPLATLGVKAGDSVNLKFRTFDKGDSIYDTAALIDNVKLQ